jgi:CubicO group peptidase (beta-lactamase class C family)
MDAWLAAGLDYVQSWLGFQMRLWDQPGCIIAIAHHDKIVLERAYGSANLRTGEKLTPRHRFRIASHSKSFTATGIMKLREAGRIRLDDTAGQYVKGLHRGVAQATIAQLLSHTAGLLRDGVDAGYFADRRLYPSACGLLAELKLPPAIDANTRLKYSNHGYGLLGLIIESITGEPYRQWIKREVVQAAALRETEPDAPIARRTPFARGHTPKVLVGQRLVIPGDNKLDALAPAGGFVSTAADTARFFAQLAPNARRSVISVASRREMIRRHWRNPNSSMESYYGLGIISGSLGGWDWFGHGGALQGYGSGTRVVPAHGLSITVFTNATDGWSGFWMDGATHILRTFANRGVAARRLRDWSGRWWSTWGALDLVPMRDVVIAANPHAGNPFGDAGEIRVIGRDKGCIVRADGYGSMGEEVRLVRGRSGGVTELWFAAARLLPEARQAAEMQRRYGGKDVL